MHSTRYGRHRLLWELAPGYVHVLRGARECARQASRPLSVGCGCGCACEASDRERGALRLSLLVAKRVIVRRLADTVPCSKRKAGSTLRSSRAVPHPSTNRALRRLTSEVGRDPVHSTRYGRQRLGTRGAWLLRLVRRAQAVRSRVAALRTQPREQTSRSKRYKKLAAP